MDSNKKLDEFKTLAQPLVQFLKENFHPYVAAVIDSQGAKMVEVIAFAPEKESAHSDE